MLTEETNKKLNTAPTTPEAEIANEESSAGGNSQRKLARSFPGCFRQSSTAAETDGEPTGTRARQEQVAVPARSGVCVALLLLFFGVFSHPKKKIALPGENPRGEASLGRKVTPGQENSDPTQIGYSDAECGCAFHRSSAGWPIDAGRYRPDLANRHGAQANCATATKTNSRRIMR